MKMMANESVPNNATNTNKVVDNIIKGFYRTETLNNSANVFTSFNDGGYVEFRGYHAYVIKWILTITLQYMAIMDFQGFTCVMTLLMMM